MSQSEKGSSERGNVKWFNDAKGFGFIEHSSGKDVFVHYSVIISDGFKTLKDGEEVEYEMIEGDKGLHAVKVRRVDAVIVSSTTEVLPQKTAEKGNLASDVEIESNSPDMTTTADERTVPITPTSPVEKHSVN